MTVGELKKLLAGEDDDTLCLVSHPYMYSHYIAKAEPEFCLYDGEDISDYEESKIDPGHLQKVLVF